MPDCKKLRKAVKSAGYCPCPKAVKKKAVKKAVKKPVKKPASKPRKKRSDAGKKRGKQSNPRPSKKKPMKSGKAMRKAMVAKNVRIQKPPPPPTTIMGTDNSVQIPNVYTAPTIAPFNSKAPVKKQRKKRKDAGRPTKAKTQGGKDKAYKKKYGKAESKLTLADLVNKKVKKPRKKRSDAGKKRSKAPTNKKKLSKKTATKKSMEGWSLAQKKAGKRKIDKTKTMSGVMRKEKKLYDALKAYQSKKRR